MSVWETSGFMDPIKWHQWSFIISTMCITVSSHNQQLTGRTWLINHQGGAKSRVWLSRSQNIMKAEFECTICTSHSSFVKHTAQCDSLLWDMAALPSAHWSQWLLSIRIRASGCICSLHRCLCQRCLHAGAWRATLSWLFLIEEPTWASEALWDRGAMKIKVAPGKRGRVSETVS